jgi:hypothetical protein
MVAPDFDVCERGEMVNKTKRSGLHLNHIDRGIQCKGALNTINIEGLI